MLLGTCVKITTAVDNPTGATIDWVKISIADSAGEVQVDKTTMTLDTVNSEYYYLFQSDDTMAPGELKVVITAASGTYRAKSELSFVLEIPEFPVEAGP